MSTVGHNQFFIPDNTDRLFLQSFNSIRDLESSMAGTRGDMAAVYSRLKAAGWTKNDIEFAKSLEDKDVVKIVAEFERKIRIAKMFGHRIGRQFDLLDTDRTPLTERAYQEGYAVGCRRKATSNPYLSGQEMSEWQRGLNEGTAFVNAGLDDAVTQADAPGEEDQVSAPDESVAGDPFEEGEVASDEETSVVDQDDD